MVKTSIRSSKFLEDLRQPPTILSRKFAAIFNVFKSYFKSVHLSIEQCLRVELLLFPRCLGIEKALISGPLVNVANSIASRGVTLIRTDCANLVVVFHHKLG